MAGSIAEFHPGLRFATPDAIAQAAALLARGRLVAFPTETVYGLGADATDESAVVGIFAAKGRPRFNPLIAHVGGLDEASAHGAFDGTARALAEAFWPGPLTLVVPARPGCRIALMARAGLDSVALRAPAHPVARALIAQAGRPLAAPSANRSGRISPTRAAEAAEELGSAVDMILDGGACEVGVE
ncbi:MAG: threonylcarbamoyl-AMP synthase, partial [Hyphomicrobiales bacterium]|nr:threonylcarbamoyl-AMP synthase [Hyphomicrobiales bacterium]